MAIWTRVGAAVARVAFDAATGAGEDPKSILKDAMDPTKPAVDVLARARARSRTGKLVAKCEELIAQRDTGITDVAAQAANWLLE